MQNYIPAIKFASSIVVGYGVGAVMGHVFNAHIPTPTTTFQRVVIQVGTGAITGAVAHAVANDVHKQIDEIVSVFKTVRNGTQETTESNE